MKSTINLGYLVFLSVVAALGGFLFGYDTAVISGTIAQVTEQFGLDALQQGWYVGCALIGSIIGVLFAGILSDKFGRKSTMILSAILFSTSAIGCAVSTDFNQLVIYRIIGGVGIGVVSIISPLYISEVAVAQYRGRLVSLYQLAVTIGFLGAYLVNYQLLGYSMSNPDVSTGWWNLVFVSEVWRGMLGMETLPAIMFFIIIFFIPESPRWLILNRILLEGANGDIQTEAKAYAAAGSDARMSGCEMPVVILSGSGNQGITASLPVIRYAKHLGASREQLLRALALSDLITIHQKTGIGRLSAYCGAISAGVGAGAGICYLQGGGYTAVAHTVVNAVAVLSGTICDGAKPSCAAKIAAAVDAGIMGYRMYLHDREFRRGEGIVSDSVDKTIRNVGILAQQGMLQTDRTILEIMQQK